MEQSAVRTSNFTLKGTDTVSEFLTDAYGTSMLVRNADHRAVLRHRRTDAGTFALEDVGQTADLRVSIGALPTIVVIHVTTSRMERTSARTEQRYDSGALFLATFPGEPYTVRWSPGLLQNCVIGTDAVARVAATAPGRLPAPVRFTSLDPLSAQAADYWWTTRCYVDDLMHNPDAAGSPLLLGNAARLLTATTLATFPNTAVTDPTIEDRHDASPPALRRAVKFVDENATRDISVADIADAAGISIRALKLTFRRHRETTPTSYLRQVRLDHAHRTLVDADPAATTVATIAARWGFTDRGRFAALHRATYGEPPSTTLRG